MLEKVSHEIGGILVTVRHMRIRDRARRQWLYNAVAKADDGDNIDMEAWQFADACCHIESVSGVDWQPPGDGDDIEAAYEAWLDLPIQVFDCANVAMRKLLAPNDPDLVTDDPND